MVEPAAFFSLAGTLALLGWVALLVTLFVKRARPGVWPVTQYVIPGLIAVAYGLLWWGGRGAYADGGFGSIPEVRVWFANDYLLTAGWLHYLAFDLFIGTWICRDAGTRRIHPLLVLPTLPLTFMFGPLGLLLWFVVRAVARVTASKE